MNLCRFCLVSISPEGFALGYFCRLFSRELWALLSFIIPEALAGEHVGEIFQSAFNFGSRDEGTGMGNATTIQAARKLLDAMMLRRIKADVVSELPAKVIR